MSAAVESSRLERLWPIARAASCTIALAALDERFRMASPVMVKGVLRTVPSTATVAVQLNFTGSSFGEE